MAAAARLLLVVPVLLALTACGPSVGSGRAAPTAPPTARAGEVDLSASLIATARTATLAVSVAPGRPADEQLAGVTEEGTRRALLVTQDLGAWLEVLLPGRPNGRHGFVRAGAVELTSTDWHLEVSLRQHRVVVYRGPRQVASYAVGVGRAVTPTPRGLYYVTDLLRPPRPDGAYGPYAFGLSAYSDTLTRFAGGPGQIGLHGTDQPAGVGADVSHGCLRLDNSAVTTLAGQLPLGTPVVIS